MFVKISSYTLLIKYTDEVLKSTQFASGFYFSEIFHRSFFASGRPKHFQRHTNLVSDNTFILLIARFYRPNKVNAIRLNHIREPWYFPPFIFDVAGRAPIFFRANYSKNKTFSRESEWIKNPKENEKSKLYKNVLIVFSLLTKKGRCMGKMTVN